MIIQRIEIKNYKSCIDTKFDLNEDLTALIGINGAGKSNILNALLLLKQGSRNRRYYRSDYQPSQITTNIYLDVLFQEEGQVLFDASIQYETDERNNDQVIDIELKYKESKKKWQSINPEFIDVASFMNRQGVTEVPRNKEFQSEKAQYEIGLLRKLTKINYYSATQFSDPSKCPISIELEDDRFRSRFRSESAHSNLIEELYLAESSNSNVFKVFLNTVGKDGIGLIDNLSFNEHLIPSSSYKVRTGGKIEKIENSKKIIIPSISVDDLVLSPNQLSEGTFKTLALVFNIIHDENDLLLIEEPEVCVHHGLLASIIELIKIYSKKKQIVISTHSDYVLDKLEPENVLLIKKEQGTTAQSLTKSLSKNDYEALKDYLDTSGNLGEYWKEGGFEDE